ADGDLAAARPHLEEASTVATQLESPYDLVRVRNCLGRLARAEGDALAAEDLHHQALETVVQHGFRGMAAETLECLGGLAVLGESDAEAARLFGAAHALREATG